MEDQIGPGPEIDSIKEPARSRPRRYRSACLVTRNLIEVSLWPIIFQVLLALMVATFRGLLERTSALELGPALGEAISAATNENASLAGTEIGVLVQFWGLCLGYIVMVLLTPVIAAMVVRGTPVGIVGGVVAAKSVDLIRGAVAAGFTAIGGAAIAGGAAAGGASAGGSAVASENASAGAIVPKAIHRIDRADTKKIDRRSYDRAEEK